jgi:hypothetical protein
VDRRIRDEGWRDALGEARRMRAKTVSSVASSAISALAREL